MFNKDALFYHNHRPTHGQKHSMSPQMSKRMMEKKIIRNETEWHFDWRWTRYMRTCKECSFRNGEKFPPSSYVTFISFHQRPQIRERIGFMSTRFVLSTKQVNFRTRSTRLYRWLATRLIKYIYSLVENGECRVANWPSEIFSHFPWYSWRSCDDIYDIIVIHCDNDRLVFVSVEVKLGVIFVRIDRKYHVLNNDNYRTLHWTAGPIRANGVPGEDGRQQSLPKCWFT